MIRALRSEWYRLWRPGMVLGGIGTMAAVAALAALLVFANAQPPTAQATPPSGPPAGGPGDRGGGLPTTVALAAPQGMVSVFTFFSGILGVISLVLFAQTTGAEYRDGTLKMLLSREPRRLAVLAGKLVAISAFVGIAILAAFVAQTATASIVSAARGLSTSAWWTADGWQNAAGVVARAWIACLVRGLLGAMMAILFRSAAPAIGVGIGYLLVGEGLIFLVWRDATKWLPNFVLGTFTAGGSSTQSLAEVSLLLAAYAAGFLLVAGATFWRRDVTG